MENIRSIYNLFKEEGGVTVNSALIREVYGDMLVNNRDQPEPDVSAYEGTISVLRFSFDYPIFGEEVVDRRDMRIFGQKLVTRGKFDGKYFYK